MKKVLASIRKFFAVNTESWHYELMDGLSEGDIPTEPSKYWFPYFAAALVFMMLVQTFYAIGWFCGYSRKDCPGDIGLFLDYRMTAKGQEKLFVPWEIGFMGWVIWTTLLIGFKIKVPILLTVLPLVPLLLIRVEPKRTKPKKLDL